MSAVRLVSCLVHSRYAPVTGFFPKSKDILQWSLHSVAVVAIASCNCSSPPKKATVSTCPGTHRFEFMIINGGASARTLELRVVCDLNPVSSWFCTDLSRAENGWG